MLNYGNDFSLHENKTSLVKSEWVREKPRFETEA